MSDDPLKPGGALEGRLFRRFLEHLSSAREPAPGDRIGAWKIVRELGRGGTGVVFLAERADGAFSQQVALKWLRADRPALGGREALARERELLASLDHPHIARLIDGGQTDDGMLWFAMDYAAGEIIDHQASGLDLRQRLVLVRTLCRAVQHAHRRGLIHGDIKPSNVLVDESGSPRLVDFGISRLKGDGLGSSYGLTPDYASPEQRNGEVLTTASDIWQLGRLLDDLIGQTRVPADLRAVVEWATAESPEDRYASAEAMATDIEAWLEHRPVAAHGGGALYRFARLVQRNRVVSSVTTVALVIIVGGGAWMTWQLAEERDLARSEAERAEAALAETQSALARARSLQEFLVGLFRASEAGQPRDQLPDTETLLERGARRAMDADEVPDAERFGMLLTIAEVYMTVGRGDEAERLLEAAIELARKHVERRPGDLAGALSRRGYMAMAAGEHERAGALFREAETVARGEPAAFDAWAKARARRAWLAYRLGAAREGRELLDELERQRREMQARMQLSTRLQIANARASIELALGDHERSLAARGEAVELARRLNGTQSRAHAIQLGNLGGLEIRLGRFGDAREHLEQAIELYDRIFERPVLLRAAARGNLANMLAYTGHYDEALETAAASAREWALAEGRDPERDEWRDYHRGRLLMRVGRGQAAARALERAMARFDELSAKPPHAPVMTRAWLARLECSRGRPDRGRDLLDELAEYPQPDNTAHRADLRESEAACLLAAGKTDEALAAIDESLELVDWPGYVLHRARRAMLRARILARQGRKERAMAWLEQAERYFLERDLVDHPAHDELRDLRWSLL